MTPGLIPVVSPTTDDEKSETKVPSLVSFVVLPVHPRFMVTVVPGNPPEVVSGIISTPPSPPHLRPFHRLAQTTLVV